jgi:hypothetical protein
MDSGTKRRHRLHLPDLSGQSLSGVMALLAVLGFAAAAAPALFTPSAAGESPFRRAPAAPDAAAPRASSLALPASVRDVDAAASGPALARVDAAPRAGAQELRTGGTPPVIRRVWFGEVAASTARDLRLQVAVSDPDSDVLHLRTRWRIDDREVETDTPVLSRAQFRRGASIRATVVASDGVHESEPAHSEEIVVANAPPLITSFPNGFDASGAFAYAPRAVDPDGDSELRFRLIEGPAGMQIASADAELRWAPTSRQAGLHRVRLEVNDGHGGSQVQHFELRVRPPHRQTAAPAQRVPPG